MVTVYPRIYLGGDEDVLEAFDRGYAVLSVCKFGPYGHRAVSGYTTVKAPDGPERLMVFDRLRSATGSKSRHWAFNVIDSDTPHPDTDAALSLAKSLLIQLATSGETVLVHCNQGLSRSPAVAFAAVAHFMRLSWSDAMRYAEQSYPRFAMKGGISTWFTKQFLQGSVSHGT